MRLGSMNRGTRLDLCEHLPLSWCQWLSFAFAVFFFLLMVVLLLGLIAMLIAFWRDR